MTVAISILNQTLQARGTASIGIPLDAIARKRIGVQDISLPNTKVGKPFQKLLSQPATVSLDGILGPSLLEMQSATVVGTGGGVALGRNFFYLSLCPCGFSFVLMFTASAYFSIILM